MARVDCPHCGRLGSLSAERIIKGSDALTTYFCDACHGEWDEREGEQMPPLRPRRRLPMTREDKTSKP